MDRIHYFIHFCSQIINLKIIYFKEISKKYITINDSYEGNCVDLKSTKDLL